MEAVPADAQSRSTTASGLLSLDVRIEDHEKQAKLIICPYYEMLARVIEYHGWPGIQHRLLTEAIDRLLPGTLKASSE
jgi:hypothetical protein